MQIWVSCPGRGIPRQIKVKARPKHRFPQRSLQTQNQSRGAHPNTPSGAGPVRSEHRNVLTLFPLARQRESPACPHVPCEHRTDPAEPTPIRQAEQDRSKANIGTSSPYSPSRASAKDPPVPTFPASTGPIPRSPPKYARRSGTGPEQALKAITQVPRAKRESSILPRAFLRAQDRSRGAHQQPQPPQNAPVKAFDAGGGVT
jgi:hypothetical protein